MYVCLHRKEEKNSELFVMLNFRSPSFVPAVVADSRLKWKSTTNPDELSAPDRKRYYDAQRQKKRREKIRENPEEKAK